MDKNQPIGIFDSGIGGMTVARAVEELLPNEDIIYFGDTAHLPYGDKSEKAIQGYSLKISDFLLEKNCKVILIACNSASSAAFEVVLNLVKEKALVLNVIDPIIHFIEKTYKQTKIGLIGTKQTINSNAYKNKIEQLNLELELKSLATPLLAHIIEEGFANKSVSKDVIEEYLSNSTLQGIESLILGCTHYPLIKGEIADYFNHKVDILDSATIVAEELKNILSTNNLLNTKPTREHHFFVSDYTKSFEESTKIFFGEKIKLEQFSLWD